MGKSQTMYKEHVVNSDEFMGLSIESQCLYFHMGLDADRIGELAGIRRLARGYGFGESELEELREAGYLLEVEGRWFIAHYYVNNTLSTNKRMREAAEKTWKSRPPSLDFEGEQFNSRLVLRTVGERSANVEGTFSLNGNCNGTGMGNVDVSVSESLSENVSVGVGGTGEGESPAPSFLPCPECGESALVAKEGHLLHGACDRCERDFFYDPKAEQFTEGIG